MNDSSHTDERQNKGFKIHKIILVTRQCNIYVSYIKHLLLHILLAYYITYILSLQKLIILASIIYISIYISIYDSYMILCRSDTADYEPFLMAQFL